MALWVSHKLAVRVVEQAGVSWPGLSGRLSVAWLREWMAILSVVWRGNAKIAIGFRSMDYFTSFGSPLKGGWVHSLL
jgi:hypothetical protein